jgi:RimJ/RimL family protein N-acetyltransferase
VTEIRTARLLIRRARGGDLDGIHRVLSDARAMRYWSTPPHTSLDQTRDWLASMIEAPAEESDDFILEREGEVIGKAGCWRLPEVGFILHPSAWGQGYAREAMEAVIERLFEVRALPRIAADVDPRNDRSQKLLTRLGFHETGRASRTWLVGEEWCDSVYFALRREDWAQRRVL